MILRVLQGIDLFLDVRSWFCFSLEVGDSVFCLSPGKRGRTWIPVDSGAWLTDGGVEIRIAPEFLRLSFSLPSKGGAFNPSTKRDRLHTGGSTDNPKPNRQGGSAVNSPPTH